MPREGTHFVSRYPRKGHDRGSITPEVAAGIGILVVIVGILLLLSCWYCRRRRSGYKILKDKSLLAGAKGVPTGGHRPRELAPQDSKLPSQEHSFGPVGPNAPPTYEKHSVDQSPPPPYAP